MPHIPSIPTGSSQGGLKSWEATGQRWGAVAATTERYWKLKIGACRSCSAGAPLLLPPNGFIKMSWSYIRQPRPQTDPATVRSARDLAQQPPTAGRSPPKTSDPPDCFLWGYLECVAYKSSPQTLVRLKWAVSAAVCVL